MLRGAPAAIKVREPKASMLTFRYTAQAGQNRVVKGAIRAVSEIAAQNLLVERGYSPITLEPIASPWSLEGALPSFFGIKPRHVITFSRQLATLLDSGVSLLPALQLLESQASSNQAFGRVVRTVAQDLGIGKSFAQAITRHPNVFNEIYSRTINVGERTGNLTTVLRQMADYMDKQGAFAKKVSGAMTYPVIVLVVGLVVSFILVTVALPPLTNLFKQLNVNLPLPTRILLGLSSFINSFLVYLLAAGAAIIAALIWYIRQPQGRRAIDRLRLSIPILGESAHMAELARICRTISVLLGAGLSLQEVMDLLPQTTSNSVVQDALRQVRSGLLLGEGLTHPMASNPLFPPLMLQMIRVGEESNSLGPNTEVLANFYEATADEKTTAMLSLIQPVSTIAIAGVAAFIALSVIMPMYSITGAVK